VSLGRWLLLGALLPVAALAEPRTHRVAPPAEGSKAEAVVVYSLGTHTQVAQDIRGEVTLDPTTLNGGSGSVVVPIAGIHGDGSTRDCHMREALGIDARWTVHGVTRPQKELTRVVREGNGLHVRGRSTVVLADYGIVVKPTKVLFADIKVGDAVTVTYDLRLVETGSPAPVPQGRSGR